jgi:chromosome segregation ATPase
MLGAVALVVLMSGCGGGGGSDSLTKAEFVKQANEICAERKDAWDSALASYKKEAEKKNVVGDLKAEKELAEGVLQDSMLPALEKQLESLEDLGQPEGKEQQAEKMVKTLSKEVNSIKSPADVLETGFKDFEEEAEALGVKCPL